MPKLSFVWSFIYEQAVHNPTVKEEFEYEKYQQYVFSFKEKIEPLWREKEEKIFSYLEEVSGLNWQKEEIPVYLIKISSIMPLSDPLTIPIQFESDDKVFTLTPERFIEMLIHELIHNLLIQNNGRVESYFKFILNKYKEEDFNTAIHLIVHAIHKKIFLEFFNKERLKEEIEASSFYPAYKRSWEIVNEKGEDFIIKEFRDYVDALPKQKA